MIILNYFFKHWKFGLYLCQYHFKHILHYIVNIRHYFFLIYDMDLKGYQISMFMIFFH